MIMVCVAIIGLILFFNLDENHAKYVNEVVESLMLLSMIAASLWFYFSLYSLDVNPHPISFLDDLLLLICLPAFFTFCVLNAISGIGGEMWFIPTNVLSVRLSDQRCFHPWTLFKKQLFLGAKFPCDQIFPLSTTIRGSNGFWVSCTQLLISAKGPNINVDYFLGIKCLISNLGVK